MWPGLVNVDGPCGFIDKMGIKEAALAEAVWQCHGRGSLAANMTILSAWQISWGGDTSIHPNIYW